MDYFILIGYITNMLAFLLLAWFLYTKHMRFKSLSGLGDVIDASSIFILIFVVALSVKPFSMDILVQQYIKSFLMTILIIVYLYLWATVKFITMKTKIACGLISTIFICLFVIYISVGVIHGRT